MKTKSHLIRLLFTTATFGALAALVQADPSPQTGNPTKPITTFTEAQAVAPDAVVTMQCDKCKTVMIRDSKHVGPTGKGSETWFDVGSKHTCSECGGEITVVKGKTTDSMDINCSKCGEGAVRCCVNVAKGK